jgi:hypothetical protein
LWSHIRLTEIRKKELLEREARIRQLQELEKKTLEETEKINWLQEQY